MDLEPCLNRLKTEKSGEGRRGKVTRKSPANGIEPP